MEFRFTGVEGTAESQTWSYTVKDGWLVASQIQGINTQGVLAAGSLKLLMRCDIKGDLLVRKIDKEVGIILLIPVAGEDDVWYHLRKVPNHLSDPTSPSVTPPAGAGVAPSVAADH